jgi:hypothetical protein
MPMIWFKVCPVNGPECEKHGPNPDFQWAYEYGTDSSPKVHEVVDDLRSINNSCSHGMVLANIWVEDEEFYLRWGMYPVLLKKLNELRDKIRNLVNETR